MKINKFTKIAASALCLVSGAAAMFGCGEKPMPPYDSATRTPTDANEIAYTINADDYGYYNNYIEFYDGDGDVYDIGDPFVFRFDGRYYLYTSLNGNKKTSGKIPCWSSENLVDWQWEGWAYTPSRQNDATSESYIAFAPEVVYYKGWFYMCESRRGEGHYFFRSDKPQGPYTKISENLGMGIDGSFHLAADGKLYFLSAENVYSNRVCWFEIDFIEENGQPKVVVDPTAYHKIDDAYENGWTEGPGVFSRNGYEYLTYAANHVDAPQYRVGYSYAKNAIVFGETENLNSPWDNVTLVSTGIDNPAVPGYASKTGNTAVTDYRGLGHSSNVVGPNLDSIYTAYHNAGRINYRNENDNTGGTRKFNVTQYFTNEGYLLTNGLGNYTRTKPEMSDYSASAADLADGKSAESTENVFTAEISFRLTNGAAAIVAGGSTVAIDGANLTVKKGGESLAHGVVPTSTNPDAIHTVKVINGASKAEIYFDNVLAAKTSVSLGAGKIGYGAGARGTSLMFTNDAFGTSDFDAVKDLTGSFPAFAYLKGENRGFSLSKGKVNANGVRQGEKETTKSVAGAKIARSISTEKTGNVPVTATVLSRGDWVKYLVNAPAADTYALNALIGKESAGCTFEIIVDNETINKFVVPAAAAFGDSDYVNLSIGSFDCGAGLHTLKIRVYDGTLAVANFSTVKDGKGKIVSSTLKSDAAADSPFVRKMGKNASYSQNGLILNPADDKTLFLTGDKGAANFEMSVNVSVVQSGRGGIMFRMNDFGYATAKAQQLNWRGYYLDINENAVTLTKDGHTKSEKLFFGRPTASLRGGAVVKITVRAENGNITISMNDSVVVSCFDPEAYLSGYIGFYSEKGAMFIYSDYSYRIL
ncbi:MAG: family 43 glycosylhydrolase [Firmicutes bacterium]|nr:family 43 glycosylhydrolase [Bacillota bacterium]